MSFGQCNASLLNKIINFFKKKKKERKKLTLQHLKIYFTQKENMLLCFSYIYRYKYRYRCQVEFCSMFHVTMHHVLKCFFV